MARITLATGKTFEYKERPDSPGESYAGGVGKARRTFDVRWEDRLDFLAGMLGWSEPRFATDGTFLYVKRVPPIPYPAVEVPGNRFQVVNKRESRDYWLYASSVESIEPIGVNRDRLAKPGPFRPEDLWAVVKDDKDMFAHALARITINYEALPYRVTTDNDMFSMKFQVTTAGPTLGAVDESYMWRYVSRTVQPHAEHLTLPFGVLKWGPDAPTNGAAAAGVDPSMAGQVVTNQTGKIVPSIELVFTWHQVPGFPEQAFKMIGRVNSQPIYDYSPGTSRAWTYGAGTLLFLGMELKSYRMSTGVYCNDVVYRMKYFSGINPTTGAPYSPERGHNYFLGFNNRDPATTTNGYGYYSLVDAAGNGVYEAADLRQLFTLPSITG